MTENSNQHNAIELTQAELHHPAWDEPIICRVEVDLPAWLTQLTGGRQWEVYSEAEEENCISFEMRESQHAMTKTGGTKPTGKLQATDKAEAATPKLAEVTLYHNGYAVVDVDGKSLFDGSLTSGGSSFAHLTYFHADSGEKITLN